MKSVFAGLIGTLLFSVVVLAFTLPAGQGFLFLLAVPFYAVLLPEALYTLYKCPERRKITYARMSIWFVTVVVLTCVHAYRADADATAATELANRIDAYRDSHGYYPATLDAVGESGIAQAHGIRYSLYGKASPSLYYRSTVSVFSGYDYDFEKRQWAPHPD